MLESVHMCTATCFGVLVLVRAYAAVAAIHSLVCASNTCLPIVWQVQSRDAAKCSSWHPDRSVQLVSQQ